MSTNKNHEKMIIKKQSKDSSFTILGNTYTGIKDVASAKKLDIKLEDYRFYVLKDRFGKFILLEMVLFPCFDSSDRMFEDRYYRRYLFCNTQEEALEKYKIIVENKNMYLSDYYSCKLAPWVYLPDGQYKIEILDIEES